MSSKEKQVEQLTTYMANFVSHIGKVLPDDIIAKLDELAEKEDSPLSKVIYETMKKNQVLAKTLNRPSCQDTGVLQFWVKCGTNFPLIGELEALLKEAVVKATFEAPLRHNSVETFDEYNTGKNVGKGTPTVFWDIVPDSDKCEIYTYMASMEKLLEDGINAIGLGPQGMGGKYSVMGVHIENTARHPSTIGVAVNVGCWSHRRGHIIFDKDLNYTITTHSGVTL